MRLDEICSHIVDCEHKTAPVTEGGGYFAVGTPAMQGNLIDYSQARQISRETYVAWTRRLTPRRGDLLFAREAPVGPVVRIPHVVNVAPGQRTVLLRPNPRIADPAFLYYLLTSPKAQRAVQDLAMGSTVPHLNVADVRALDLTMPSLGEQRAIAEVLGALDDKIAANNAAAERADELVRAMYQHLVQGELQLRDICSNPRANVLPGREVVPYVGLEHLPRRHLWLGELGASSEVTSAKTEFAAGDTLFGKLRPYFHKVVSAPVEGVCSTDILVLRPREVQMAGLVLAAAASDETVNEMAAKSAGTKMPRANWQDLSACKIRGADDLGTREFSRRVMAIRDAVEMSSHESRTLAQLRDTLLPALMDGTLRVKDAVAQAEEVL